MRRVFLSLLILLACVFTQAQKTVKFKPNAAVGQDALISINQQGFPNWANTNFGNDSLMIIEAWTWNGDFGITRVLLKFAELSTIPTNATIINAELRLYGLPINGGHYQGNSCYPGSPYSSSCPNKAFIQKVTSVWNEQTVTWNTQPTTTTINQITIPQTNLQWNWNFTDSSANLATTVQDWVSNPAANFGFMIRLETESTYRIIQLAFSDHSNATLHPELTVVYIDCQADTTIFNEVICAGDTYSQNGFNVSISGIYEQKLKNSSDCDSIIILNLNVILKDTTKINAAICEGNTYSKNGFNETESGTYTQELQNRFDCDSTVILNLTVVPPNDDTLFFTASICEGETYSQNGFNASKSGIYMQNLLNYAGCDSLVVLNLTVNPNPDIEINALTDRFCEEDFILLEIHTNGDSFLWNTGSSENTITITKSGTYSATAYLGNCKKTAYYILDECPCIVFIPNAFTPNGDGLNDVWKPVISCSETMTNYKLTIYDRWGNRIFQSADYNVGWSGRDNNGRDYASGVYNGIFEYTTAKDGRVLKTVLIVLVR